MANSCWPFRSADPTACFRPYVTAGLAGFARKLRSASDVFDDINSNDTGYNFGAGAHSSRPAFRPASRCPRIRGFESIDDEDPVDNPFFDQAFATDVFNFWRGTIGLTFRFGR